MGFHHGLSGLNGASKNLDVIGHNIANSNTVGFKNSRAEFNEMVASAMGAASTNNTGIGVSVAAISQQFSQGVITPSAQWSGYGHQWRRLLCGANRHRHSLHPQRCFPAEQVGASWSPLTETKRKATRLTPIPACAPAWR